MKPKLRREISDRPFEGMALLSVGILAREILLKGAVHFREIAQESFVLRHLDETRLPRELQHAQRIMIR